MKEFKFQIAKSRIYLIFLFSLFILHFSVLAAWLGLDTCPQHYGVRIHSVEGVRFQAPEDGISTRLEVLTFSSTKESKGTFRMAVYDDDDGDPENKLWEGTDQPYVGGEWCGEDVTSIELTQDAYYWFAFKVSQDYTEICYVAGGPPYSHHWKGNQPYEDSFPDPWGSSSGTNTNRYTMRMHYVTSKGTKGIVEIDPGIIEGGFAR
jgi:hypothetical protein